MSTIASTLLDFLLDLFRDPDKAAAYQADPRSALDAAGLHDTTEQDVADLAPMVADYATVTGWSGGGSSGRGDQDDDRGGHDRDGDEGGRARDCDDDRGGSSRPVDDEHEGHSGGGVAPVDRDGCEPEEEGNAGGGGHHHHAPAPAGGTETVVITHLQEVHHTHNETTVEIDASHSIWVSGDAQAIFGDVEGDVTQIDNEGGIVAGDDVEDSPVDNSDNSVRDSHDTDVDVALENSPVNVGGDQAVDSFNQDNDGLDVEHAEDSFNGNGSGNEDNDVIADRGGQVGDRTDNSIEDSFNGNDLSQDNDGVDDSLNGNELSNENVGNDHSDNSETDNSVDDSFNGNDLSDDDGVDDSFNGSLNGNDLSDDDGVDGSFNGNEDNDTVTTEDSFNSDDDGLDDSLNGSLNGNALADDGAEAATEDVTVVG
jgi:hypothetical protein